MSLGGEKSFKMRMRDMENAFKYRRIPYPKRSVELIAILAISCTFFLFMHTNKLNSRLKEMEIKLQPSEFSALGLTGNQISPRESSRRDNINTLHGTYQYLKSTGQLKKLSAERLNNTRKAEIDVIFFNRCAKVGSESLLELFNKLEDFNNLVIEREGLRRPTKRQLKKKEQIELAETISGFADGSVYIEHVNWIDFEEYDLPKPIYINLVRDPVERVISWYFYARGAYKNAIEYRKDPNKPIRSTQWYKKDFNECVRSGDPECQYVPFTTKDFTGNYKRQTLFFCGHHEDCLPFNSPAAVQMAKEHVERDYAVVGSWEDTNITLTVFEKYIPRFFQGAKILFESMWFSNFNKQFVFSNIANVFIFDYNCIPISVHNNEITTRNKNKRKPKIDADVKEMIRKNFTNEYDFYYFCKQRLYKQYLAVNLKNIETIESLN
ncbi:heparan sulfate 2-O-sulfotransferase pipe isoform X2 [Bactrocera dorsalis]|uniref:Heparan sulfate 2-O-sulfotransferase pipe isoform X2 n=1 Tax=Bactrocera dorsalis TaxID=27457 RepID=A0ABM3JZ91_BACDO|nr:heparan sulfate 2-O-sulfotransferase pipe isoform X2 [Bactrocera dorsalis]